MADFRARWIGPAHNPREDLGVFAFRCRVDLEQVPDELTVRLSADNRYKLYVNGEMVSFGPQRGDERHWFYESINLAPHLKAGENWIVALVWNFGRWAPMAQHTVRTAFFMDGGGIDTPGCWEVARLDGWDFDMIHRGVGEFYIDVGPGEILHSGPSATVDGIVGEPGRELVWKKPHVICQAEERGASGGGTPWMLVPRSIPPMRYQPRVDPPLMRNHSDQPFEELTLSDGEHLLLDHQELLCAYPRVFLFSKGRATVTLTYDEALWGENGKGNRDEIEGKESRGYQDRVEINGWSLAFEPLWWRTYRYLRIDVSGHPVTIQEIDAMETGYPLQVESSFEADDPWVERIWDVSIRTAERCAGETYFDCPYYEQLQYVGDTRIQALIGYYLGRDRQLQRNAVETLGWSIMENGLTQSRYPSRQTQVIPPFSLWWLVMLYDQLLYDTSSWFPEKESSPFWEIFQWHWVRFRLEAEQEFWPFTDWCPEWPWGVAPGGIRHPANMLIQEFASQCIGDFLKGRSMTVSPNMPELPKISKRRDLIARAYAGKWGGEWADPTEHAEAMWRVLQVSKGITPDPWPTEALAAANAAKCTYYFAYYKHLAMFSRTDAPFDYMQELQPWKEQIEMGLTTFAENPEPTRSDCHAWSAHPILGFFQIVAGVTSIAPGWKKAQIMPHPGSLKRFDARIAHPDGELRVLFENEHFSIDSPVPFEFVWQDRRQSYDAGTGINI